MQPHICWTRFSLGTVLAIAPLFSGHSLTAQGPAAAPDAQVQADVQKALHGKEFRDVQSSVQNGGLTLSGTVKLYADKLDAEKRVTRLHETASVNDQIKVDAPPGITDQQLFNKLARTLAFQRVGSGESLPFNSIILRIQGGVAELGGLVVAPADKNAAVDTVITTPGIRGLVDHLQVAPPSPSDWSIRRAEYQAIYGSAQITRYAIDPGKPIRIVVLNGNVVLTGVVNTKADSDFINIRANGVPGVFSVKNELQVQGQGEDRER